MKTMRKGFTLVELLIVIVVIGVLAAMMMLASDEAVTSAKAIRIINDLNLMKRAVNAWYLDNYQRLAITTANNGYFVDAKYNAKTGKYEGGTRMHDYLNNHPEEIAKYFSTNNAGFNMSQGSWTHASRDQYYATTGNYGIYFGYSNTVCYVLYKISDHNDNTEARLKAKLKARAESAGLLAYDYLAGSNKHKYYDGKSANIFMEAFKLTN